MRRPIPNFISRRGRWLAGIGGCLALAALPVLGAQPQPQTRPGIVNTKHNLAVSGPGDIRSATETEICDFCHAPHSVMGETPLWNHRMPTTAYTPYSSATLKATVGQPTGSSRLCLSCHDGTVAVGMVGTRRTPVPLRNGTLTMPSGGSRLGTDLSGHHPISFTYDSVLATRQGELRDPRALNREVRVDHNQQMQCTSCHDPHNNQYGQFLVKPNTASALCLECHTPNQWNNSAHAISTASWNGTGRNPWSHTKETTVAANGCENCHRPHAAGTKPSLLNFAPAEENCLVCHNGSVAAQNLAVEFNKPSSHPITGMATLRDAAAGPLQASAQHVSCVDCHDPHATRNGTIGTGSGLSGALALVKGVNAAGTIVNAVTREYELCFRCHASGSAAGSSSVPRQFSQANTRLQFNPGNASYHPVLGAAKSGQDATLISPWTAASQMSCGDCHNNDQGPGAKGAGPSGPHGSRYAPLLERNLVQVDFEPESPTAYALCYKCHSESVLLADRMHRQHVRDQKTSCTTCHDAHGVQTQPHLINFNTLYVKPLNGRVGYTDLGGGRSSCTLSCHGADHNNKSY